MRRLISRLYWFLSELPFFPLLNIPVRIVRTFPSVWIYIRTWGFWIFTSREDANLTYVFDTLSRKTMIASLASVLDREIAEVRRLFDEVDNDIALRHHVEQILATGRRRFVSDPVFRPSRRMAWYVLVRLLKPRIIVETGVDKGLGGVLLCAALLRNAEEGYPGRYFGTDKNPSAGELISGPYASVGKLLYGDSIESLRRFSEPIDLFINDSDHSADYEALEYEVILPKLTPKSVIIGDNARWTDRLLAFSEKYGRPYFFIDEKPEMRWIPNEGVGLSFPPKSV